MRKKIWMVLCIVALLACAACVGIFAWAQSNKNSTAAHYDSTAAVAEKTAPDSTDSVDSAEVVTETEEVVPHETTASEKKEEDTKLADIPIDFTALQAKNPDIYAWIEVPGTDISYPILQSATDDTFYLSHDEDGNYLFAGSIYTESLNSRDFNDPNTVIYGHNMNNGSMFAQLHRFEDRTFFEENRNFYIYTPSEKLTYEIFAAYDRDDQHILKTNDFSNEQVWKDYLYEIMNERSMNAFYSGTTPKESDKLVTLSTCTATDDYKRYVVQGVLQSREEGK